ncbi:MAG: hypothetical protein JRE27_12720 [Deltaproteobacteria bacterium]|nr:hypothetical protein [Deltaproteobacteria bacterium]
MKPRINLNPLAMNGKPKNKELKIATATPVPVHNDISSKNCRLGWAEAETENTKKLSRGLRRAHAATKKVVSVAPNITGGSVSINGQTCPP